MYHYGMYQPHQYSYQNNHWLHDQMRPTGQVPAGTQLYNNQVTNQTSTQEGMLSLEQSYIENILRFNRGKRARFYMTFENNPEWPARVFEGIIEEAGRDHIIVSSVDGGPNYLLLMVSLDFVEFDEEIDYVPPAIPGYAPTAPQR